ncbi:molybdopterin-guanine dinucleotide biosynthesis protein B [Dehalogenimonas sp. 4OHTPN]|uniref:Molybdopterin-guanine dinucleotide biosynthesis protein B n=1 Tax=Dehalogenimonas sp. 4OHTPN TaxID=3166643 RepID=A0AAU8G6F1_9CHLR
MTAPIIAFVGRSESGKTTFIERLVPELKSRGYKAATVKHVPQHFHPAAPVRDTERHLAAGAEATIAATPGALILTKPCSSENPLDEIARLLGDEYDIIIVEGFKNSGIPKFEIWRRDAGTPLEDIKSRVAVITDDEYPDESARRFRLSEVREVADLIEKGYILPNLDRISLNVNGESVALSAFPREFMTNIVNALIASLKGVPPVKWLEIRLRRSGNHPA